MGLIFAALGADQLSAVVSSEETAIVVLMVVVTTLAAPVVLHRMLHRVPAPTGRVEAPEEVQRAIDSPTVGGPETDPVAEPDDPESGVTPRPDADA